MTQKPRQFTLKDQAPASVAYGSAVRQKIRGPSPTTSTPGPGGEVQPEGGFEDQAGVKEWLRHLEAGRIGGA